MGMAFSANLLNTNRSCAPIPRMRRMIKAVGAEHRTLTRHVQQGFFDVSLRHALLAAKPKNLLRAKRVGENGKICERTEGILFDGHGRKWLLLLG
jgi:hypothetical protein